MTGYHVVLKLEGARCLVIGSMFGAEKTAGLERAGAVVVRRDSYAPGDLEGFFLVIAAGGDHAQNARVWEEASSRGMLCNAADDPANSNFILPAVHRQGDLTFAVSTAGKSPALAARLRDKFAAALGPEYAALLDLLGDLRPRMAQRFANFRDRKPVYDRMIDSPALDLLRRGDTAGAREALEKALEEPLNAGQPAVNSGRELRPEGLRKPAAAEVSEES